MSRIGLKWVWCKYLSFKYFVWTFTCRLGLTGVRDCVLTAGVRMVKETRLDSNVSARCGSTFLAYWMLGYFSKCKYLWYKVIGGLFSLLTIILQMTWFRTKMAHNIWLVIVSIIWILKALRFLMSKFSTLIALLCRAIKRLLLHLLWKRPVREFWIACEIAEKSSRKVRVTTRRAVGSCTLPTVGVKSWFPYIYAQSSIRLKAKSQTSHGYNLGVSKLPGSCRKSSYGSQVYVMASQFFCAILYST